MILKRLFSRKEKEDDKYTVNNSIKESKISYETEELKEFISDWIKKSRWSLENIEDIIKELEIDLPVQIQELNKQQNSFVVISKNRRIQVFLNFYNIYYFPNFIIKEGEEEKKYIVEKTCNTERPKVFLEKQTITRNNCKLECKYSINSFCLSLKLNKDESEFMVYVDDPYLVETRLQNLIDLKEYLLGVYVFSDTNLVFEEISRILDLKEKTYISVKVSYHKVIKLNNKELSQYIEFLQPCYEVIIENGKIVKYTISEGKETFSVNKNGSWEYMIFNDLKIVYNSEIDKYSISIQGKEGEIIKKDFNSILYRAKGKISKLYEIVK